MKQLLLCCSLLLLTGPVLAAGKKLPKLTEYTSGECVPCKLMTPVLEKLGADLAGKVSIEIVNTTKKENAARIQQMKIETIPTQVFSDADGKELWRHEGYISRWAILDKWHELGVDVPDENPRFARPELPKPDDHPRDQICFMCDGDPDPKCRVTVKSAAGDVNFCGPHHFFVMLSVLEKNKDEVEKAAQVVDWEASAPVGMMDAAYLVGLEEKSGRPWIKAFATAEAARKTRSSLGGSVVNYGILKTNELAVFCGFCDRAVYPQDAAAAKIDGLNICGCCPHCALGIAARTYRDIEVRQPDALTGEIITVKTGGGYVLSMEPKTAVAWFGQRKDKDGKFVSAGCFHQAFFVNEENLKKWVDAHPRETGKAVTLDQVLADKMKLTPGQIRKAGKIDECRMAK